MPEEAASGLWRSQDMVKLDLIMQRDSAHDTIYHLGMTGMVQFLDSNAYMTAFQRPFTADIRRCDDLERRLRYVRDQMKQCDIDPTNNSHDPHYHYEHIADLNPIETALEVAEKELKELNSNLDSMAAEKNRCRECYEVLVRNQQTDYAPPSGAPVAAGGGGPPPGQHHGYHAGGGEAEAQQNRFKGLLYVAGVIPAKDTELLSKAVYRITRGNSVLTFQNVEEPFEGINGAKVYKSVFVVYVSAERALNKLTKLMPSLGANTYQFTNDNLQTAYQLKAQLVNFSNTVAQSLSRKVAILDAFANNYTPWVAAVLVEKNIFVTLNKFHFKGSVANGQCWIATEDLPVIRQALDDGSIKFGQDAKPIINTAHEQKHHPTKFKTNKMTAVFQGIVDSYGIPHYKEVNPGVLTIVTFPWLFGIMYGDIGHGALITAFAGFMIFKERVFESSKQNEIFEMIFGGRYLIFFMGIMAIYVGLLYNDFFGVSLSLFSSAYVWPALGGGDHGYGTAGDGYQTGIVIPLQPTGRPDVKPAWTYTFGIDVAWTETDNKLEFYNSVKMKCAVIVGVVQMTAGLFCSLLNHIYHKNYRYIVCGFIPEVVFLTCTFGYMSLLIVGKWCTHWDGRTNDAPSLLETMTNFFLAPGEVKKPLYAGQAGFQVFLLLLAFSMVPVLLLGVPLYTRRQRKIKQRAAGGAYQIMGGGGQTAAPSAAQRREEEAMDRNEEGGYQEQSRTGFSNSAGPDAKTGFFAGAGPVSAAPADTGDQDLGAGGDAGDQEDEQPFSEIMIHYIIHTIEFVLGCVSNTASYLRLWALSLAHAQLSEVFLNFGLVGAMTADSGHGFIVLLGVGVWLGATIGVLILMESLSAFLHALRLHWVEFQNKFYKGDGIAFCALDLMEVAKTSDAELGTGST